MGGMSAASYAAQLAQLLPRGRAWRRGGMLDALLAAFAEEFARADARAVRLLDEADPLSALELLPEWERVAGLPDACVPVADGIRDRQVAAARKIAGAGGQTPAFFIDLAERLGVEVRIEEFAPFVAGSLAGELVYSDAWAFTWRVRVLADSDSTADPARLRFAWFQAGLSSAGDPLRSFGIDSLECLIRRAAPAHTTVLFAYPDDPEPMLWFDFLTGV